MLVNKKILISLNIIIFLSFFFGYFIGENSAGGGPGDYNHIATNYNLIFQNNIKDIDWDLYDPLDILFTECKYKNISSLDYSIIKLNNFTLSLIVPIIICSVI